VRSIESSSKRWCKKWGIFHTKNYCQDTKLDTKNSTFLTCKPFNELSIKNWFICWKVSRQSLLVWKVPHFSHQFIEKVSIDLSNPCKINYFHSNYRKLPFYLKTPDIIFSVMQKPFKKACFLWGLAGFYITEKNLSGVFKKTAEKCPTRINKKNRSKTLEKIQTRNWKIDWANWSVLKRIFRFYFWTS
jgi:hypothetical protein